MVKRTALPVSLSVGPFRVGDADAAGLPRHRLRASDLYRDVHGTRILANEVGLAGRCALFQTRLPSSAFFSHATAARLHGMPLPGREVTDPRVHVAMPAPERPQHANGIAGHMLQVENSELMTLPSGLRVTTPLRTWLDLGSSLPLLHLVAAGDYLIHWRSPIVNPADIEEAVSTRRNRRGRGKLRTACTLLHERAESAPESILRTMIVLAGLPAPRVNHEVTDRFGEFIARTDLIIDEYRLIIEYQGDYHRTTKSQWRSDMTRRSRLESQGWRVLEVNADDLRHPDELMTRIRAFARLAR